MSVETSRGAPERAYSDPYAGGAGTRGDGWLIFAGVMLAILSVMNVIGGIAAIDDSKVYVRGAEYTFGDLNTWGWVLLCTGVVQGLAAFGVWVRNQIARWLGVGFAALNMLAQFLFLPAFPLWCIAMIAIDTMVIYGLAAYGGRNAA
jgi:hypothetical protein